MLNGFHTMRFYPPVNYPPQRKFIHALNAFEYHRPLKSRLTSRFKIREFKVVLTWMCYISKRGWRRDMPDLMLYALHLVTLRVVWCAPRICKKPLIKLNLQMSRQQQSLPPSFVQRWGVWNNVVQELRRTEINTFKMSVDFIGECAADTGGPTRELLSLVYKDVMRGKLTRGNMPNLTHLHMTNLLSWLMNTKFLASLCISILK